MLVVALVLAEQSTHHKWSRPIPGRYTQRSRANILCRGKSPNMRHTGSVGPLLTQVWITQSTDGCFKSSSSQAWGGGGGGGGGAGGWGRGLLRDHEGRWLDGFSTRFGTCSMVEAELWALIHGLRIAWERGISQLVVEIDSLLVHKWMTKSIVGTTKHPSLIQECHNLLRRNWTAIVRYVYREKKLGQLIF